MRDTIDMAREAGLLPILDEYAFQNWEWEKTKKVLKCFEALVRADEREAFRKIQFESILQAIKIEREACAKVCDDGYDTFFANNGVEHNRKRYDQQAVERAIKAGVEFVTADCAAAIRARGNA
jgi:tartrate dehydratase alpha subunit/fumarate hydratase class I-like protein